MACMLEPHATLTRTTCVFKRIKARPWFAVLKICEQYMNMACMLEISGMHVWTHACMVRAQGVQVVIMWADISVRDLCAVHQF